MMALLGLPALRYLESEDRDEQLLLLGLLDRAVTHLDTVQRNLAFHIVQTYAKARR
jgi:hypothetical protein